MRALVVTHGNLGRELIASAREVYAADAPLDHLSNSGADVQTVTRQIEEWLVGVEGPALVMVDVGGGSCGIAAIQAAMGRPSTWILGGVNLPMVLTYLTSAETLGPDELVAKVLDRALNAVDLLGAKT